MFNVIAIAVFGSYSQANAELVRLKLFIELSLEQIAAELGISRAIVSEFRYSVLSHLAAIESC